MWNWFRQKFISPRHCVSLIHHANDEKDAPFFKEALESTFNCEVVTHPWLKENQFTLTTQAALDRDPTLILFMLSHIFLEDLDEQPKNGRDELYRRAVGPQPERPKSIGKAIVVDKTIDDNRHQDKYKAIFEKLEPPIFYRRDESTKKSFTDTIGTIVKLPRRSSSSTGLMHSMAADSVVSHDPASVGVTPVPELLWLVPDDDEHQKPEYEPSAVRPYGRQEVIASRNVLNSLYERFCEEGRGRPYQILHGLPGIGKTAIALHYVYRYSRSPLREQSNARYRVVLWLDAKDGLDNSYKALSQYPSLPQELKESPIQGDGIKKWLQEKVENELLQNDERWLLIIDGCTDFTSIGELYPRQSSRGDILITTHEKPLPTEDRYTLEVQQLSGQDGVDLLAQTARRVPDVNKYEQAIEIVHLLHGLPLAIQLAGFFIAGLGNYKSFLDRYNSEDMSSSQALGERVTRPFEFLLNEIRQKNDKAYELLICCALFGQKPLPAMLIKKTLAAIYDRDIDRVFEEVTRTLSDFSLLKRTPPDDQEEQLFNMPSIVLRLIQEMTIQSKIENEQKPYAEKVVKAIIAALPQGKWDRWSNWRFYLPHVHVCIKYIHKFNITNTMMVVRLLYATGRFYTEQSQYELPREPGAKFGMNAKDLLLQALRIRRRLLRVNPQDSNVYPDLLTCRYGLAELYHKRFLYEDSKKRDPQKTYKRIKNIYNAILTARSSSQEMAAKQPPLSTIHDASSHLQLENVDTVSVLNSLGRLYDDFDQHKEAKEKFTEALDAMERPGQGGQRGEASVEERLTKVVILNNLAVTLMKANEFKEAKNRLDGAFQILNSLKQELDGKNSDPSVREQMKRRDDHYQQCKVNQAMLDIVQADTERRMPRPVDIKTVRDTLPANMPDINKVSEVDYLHLLKRFNNVAEFYRLRKDEKQALRYYKQAIDASVIFREHEQEKGKISLHPIVASVLDSFEVFIKYSKFSEREKDENAIAAYEEKVSEVRASVSKIKFES